MEEDELFDKFYAKLKDIVNTTFNLGETIHEPKIVRKVFKSKGVQKTRQPAKPDLTQPNPPGWVSF